MRLQQLLSVVAQQLLGPSLLVALSLALAWLVLRIVGVQLVCMVVEIRLVTLSSVVDIRVVGGTPQGSKLWHQERPVITDFTVCSVPGGRSCLFIQYTDAARACTALTPVTGGPVFEYANSPDHRLAHTRAC